MLSNRIVFKSHSKIIGVDFENIVFCKAENSYTRIYLKNGSSLLISKPIREIKKLLPAKFIRCHRSFLINKSEVQSFSNFKDCFIMSSGSKIPVAKSRLSSILNAFAGHFAPPLP